MFVKNNSAGYKTPNEVRTALYTSGVMLSTAFLRQNKIPLPHFYRYEDVDERTDEHARKMLERTRSGPTLGTGTGLYTRDHVFVNVPVTALPVHSPRFRSWSWPGWKTDRTAIGVVAHEVGHHVEAWIGKTKLTSLSTAIAAMWRNLIFENRKRVSGYEPVSSEAWAETMRLFILNPDLLRRAIPERYDFVVTVIGLKPSEKRTWKKVLFNPAYIEAGQKWIAK